MGLLFIFGLCQETEAGQSLHYNLGIWAIALLQGYEQKNSLCDI